MIQSVVEKKKPFGPFNFFVSVLLRTKYIMTQNTVDKLAAAYSDSRESRESEVLLAVRQVRGQQQAV